MSHFSDQFDLEDPFDFEYPEIFGNWPELCSQECRDLLRNLSIDKLRSIACSIERAIEAWGSDKHVCGAPPVPTGYQNNNIDVTLTSWPAIRNSLRVNLGALYVWQLAVFDAKENNRALFVPGTNEAEALAVLAIWKLIDSKNAMRPRTDESGRPEAHPSKERRLAVAASLAMQAMAAAKMAVHKQMEGKLIAAAVQDAASQTQLAIKEKVSKRHSKGAIDGHEKLTGNAKARAIQIANARQFATYVAACSDIKPKLESELKCFVELRTITKWLKASGWTPAKRDSSNPK